MEFFYFDISFWRGSLPRMLIKMGGLDVVDHKVTPAQFMEMIKDGSAPFKQLPVLKVGDVTVTQAAGILKFFGKKTGFYPTDDLEAAKVDEVLLMFEEMATILTGYHALPDPEEEKACREFLDKEYVKNIDKLLEGKDFVVGDRITIADLLIWSIMPWLEEDPFFKFFKEGDFVPFRNIQNIVANVDKDDRIIEYKASL